MTADVDADEALSTVPLETHVLSLRSGRIESDSFAGPLVFARLCARGGAVTSARSARSSATKGTFRVALDDCGLQGHACLAMALGHHQPDRGPMTRAEYEGLVRRGALDDARVELLYGRLISMLPQGEPHTYSVSQLMTLLVRALGDRARVRVQAPFAAPDASEPEPDVA